MTNKIDQSGTCHTVGCPGKGVHRPHHGVRLERRPDAQAFVDLDIKTVRGGVQHGGPRIRDLPEIAVGDPGVSVRLVGCLTACVGSWPGGQPFHVKGCPNDGSRHPESPAQVMLGQEHAVALLDWLVDTPLRWAAYPGDAVHASTDAQCATRSPDRGEVPKGRHDEEQRHPLFA